MKDLFLEPTFTPRGPGAVVVSLWLHLAAIALIAMVGTREIFAPRHIADGRLTYLMFAAPRPHVDRPVTPVPKSERRTLAALKITPAPRPVPEPERPAPPPEPVVRPPAAKVEPPPSKLLPPKPAVTVGAFSSVAPIVPSAQPRRNVESAGFDSAPAVAPDVNLKTAAVGLFDASPSHPPGRPGTDRPGVAASGFEGTPGQASGGPRPARSVANAGFGGAQSATPPRAGTARTEVQASGFGDARTIAPKTSASAQQVDRTETPVEVTFKPTPVYTDEARSLKVEGDVILEVEFTAANTVRVIRVVRGLGHGLDETATQAAEKIRFKPAAIGGRPVDFRTRVTIVFRLT